MNDRPMASSSSSAVDSLSFLSRGGAMGERIRAADWSRTPLGPPEGWPQSLKITIRLMLTSRYAMWLAWGSELTFFCNDAYRPTLGVKDAWALGMPASTVWAEIWPDVWPRIESVFKTGTATWDEDLQLFLERSGYPEETYHTFSYSPVSGDDGGVAGMLCVVTEDTKRVVGERRLRVLRDVAARAGGASSAAMAGRALAAVLNDNRHDVPFSCLYALDQDRRARLIATSGGIANALVTDTVNLDDSRQPWSLATVVDTGQSVDIDDLPRTVGSIECGPWPDLVQRAVALPLKGSGQSNVAAVLVAGVSPRRELDEGYRDFLDLLAGQFASALADAQAYEMERQRAEALAEIDRAKTTFFSNVSHEFRTPLTLMMGPLEDVLTRGDGRLSPEEREQIEVAHRNSLRLLRLVNSLLDFSRLEAGRIRTAREKVDLSQLTAEIASVFRSAVERAGMRLVIDCPPLSRPVFVDRDMWEKIVLNLLSNAFKFTLEGEIRVALGETASGPRLIVADTGTGIPEASLPHMFERFYRVPNARGRTHEGTGIGLALVHELIKLHGGSIEVRSELGKGTEFSVVMPWGSDDAAPGRVRGERDLAATRGESYIEEALRWLPREALAHASSPRSPRQDGEAPSRFATVLVVDDNADMRDYVVKILADRYSVVAADDGERALAALARATPDLVLTDVMMPRLDGFGLLKAIRDNPATRDLPVILLSARAGEEAKVEGLGAGADDYLIKPFSARELLARVGANIRLSRLRRDASRALREADAQKQQALEAINRELRDADRRKDEFLATLAHELRNPLAPVRQAAKLLKSKGVEARDAAWAREVIERQVQHMALMLDDLLDVSRISRGKLDLRKEYVDLSAVVDSAIETTRPLLDAKSHRLDVELPPVPVRLQADPLRLSQILANLLTNAAKYTDSGGRIGLRATRDGNLLRLTVSDSGIGIDPKLMPTLFQMFSQGSSAIDRTEGGLGIGLALVRGLVDRHGGTVEARSEGVGKGSEFIVSIPLDESAGPVTAPAAPPAAATERVTRKVLVADDNRDAAETLRMLLELEGHDVRVAHDGSEAVDAARDFVPEFVLLDIGMPRLNGYEAARRIRAEAWGARATLIALTGWGQDEDKRRTLAAGFDHHLTKPIDPDHVLGLIR